MGNKFFDKTNFKIVIMSNDRKFQIWKHLIPSLLIFLLGNVFCVLLRNLHRFVSCVLEIFRAAYLRNGVVSLSSAEVAMSFTFVWVLSSLSSMFRTCFLSIKCVFASWWRIPLYVELPSCPPFCLDEKWGQQVRQRQVLALIKVFKHSE